MTYHVNDNWGIMHTLGLSQLNSKNLSLWIHYCLESFQKYERPRERSH